MNVCRHQKLQLRVFFLDAWIWGRKIEEVGPVPCWRSGVWQYGKRKQKGEFKEEAGPIAEQSQQAESFL